MLKQLEDQTILESYHEAMELGLEKDFILILKEELETRNIT